MLSDIFTARVETQLVLSLFLISVLYFIYSRLTKTPTVFDELPWGGLPEGRFARLRAKFSIASSQKGILDACEKYTLNGKVFIWQEFLGKPLVVLPPSLVKWLLDQPHDVVSVHEFFSDFLALDVSLMDPQVHGNPLHIKVVSNHLNRALNWTSSPLMDELSKSFDELWGSSSEWQDHVVWGSFLKVVARTVNRMFVGTELCRDQDFLNSITQYAVVFVAQGLALRPFPRRLRAALSWLLTIPIRVVYRRVYKKLGPVIERRKADIERSQTDPAYQYEDPNDLLQWLITSSYSSTQSKDRDTHVIAKRFLTTNFAAIHTTTLNATSLFLYLASTDPKDNVIGRIRDQIVQIDQQHRGKWDKLSLSKLTLLDSALRETLRLTGGGGVWTPQRKVVAKAGLSLPNGTLLPNGTHIGIPSWSMHQAEKSFSTFNPFRWATERSELGATGHNNLLGEQNLQATATSLKYLPFGHGRDACPGRFFAVQEIKLMMVHLLLNYEIMPLMKMPQHQWIADMPGPPRDAKITVRRRPLRELSA